MEEDVWRQKATLNWFADGDKNTRFYQSWVRQKRVRLRIHKIHANGRELTEEEEIKESAVEFYKNLLAPDNSTLAASNLNLINQLPPSAFLEGLANLPDAEEIKGAYFDMSWDSTPGPDGYLVKFYHVSWPIVGSDIVDAMKQFFAGAFLPRSITATSIVLIPKKVLPETWADYRPISLCNVINKAITKILMARLTPFLPRVISPN